MSKRDINGIVLVNKSQGLTSNGVLQRVKHLFHAKKAGHTGSLDPMATGMLPVCFGEATKLSQFILDADKCYEVTGLFGIQTNTGDAMGTVISSTDQFNLSEATLQDALSSFRGPIQQIPPMHSALKHQGQPLYKLARAGVTIDRKPRQILIHQLTLLDFDGQVMRLRVRCSKGTYIRSLVEDIGHYVGVGAHVTQLHRSYTAGFEQDPMYTLDDLATKDHNQLMDCLLPMEYAIQTMPRVDLSAEQARMIYQGRVLADVSSDGAVGCVQLYENGCDFIGIGEWTEIGVLKAKRLKEKK